MVRWQEENGGVTVYGAPLSPALTLDCGQCFRFALFQKGMLGVAHARAVYVTARGEGAWHIAPATAEDFSAIWTHYFDIGMDYEQILAGLAENDPLLERAAACCRGLRLLHQEPFETLVSFIISANNNIPRIRWIIEALCREAGEPVDFYGERFFAFPTPQALSALSEDRLRSLGCGYRAPYIRHTAQMIAQGFALEEIAALPDRQAKERLMQLSGVGSKVADCILLFAYGRRASFPLDVWMRRVLAAHYGAGGMSERRLRQLVQDRFGQDYAGIAQQYLFAYIRMHPDSV